MVKRAGSGGLARAPLPPARNGAFEMRSVTSDRAAAPPETLEPAVVVEALRATLGELEDREVIPPEAGLANAHLGRLLLRQGDDEGAAFHLVRAVYLMQKSGPYPALYEALIDLAALHRARGEARLAFASRVQAGRLRADVARGAGPRRWTLIEVEGCAAELSADAFDAGYGVGSTFGDDVIEGGEAAEANGGGVGSAISPP